jgi:RNA polymerase sigma-70 factor (ECF subfamily)
VEGTDTDRAHLATLFDEFAPRVFAYARRQCDLASAQDVVSETFLVAWRRISAVPAQPLPWLLVVARNTIANRRRHELRQDQLADRVARLDRLAGPANGADQSVVERDSLLAALAELTTLEREALLLVAWDGLSGTDAAAVAGCSVRAFEVRLSRARARLARAADDPSPPSATRTPSPIRKALGST